MILVPTIFESLIDDEFCACQSAQHAAKGWRRPAGFAHAAAEAVVPLVGAEFGKAATAMPIAFVAQAGGYQPVALMSPIAGRNLFIGPAGQWLGGYVPAFLRAYPFRLARANETEQAILCIDEDSGLVVDADGAEQSFFDADGKPSPETKAVLDFLWRSSVAASPPIWRPRRLLMRD